MIHQYKLNGYNIVLDVNSGSVHLVDGAAYDIIALYGKKTAQEIISEVCQKHKDISSDEVLEVWRILSSSRTRVSFYRRQVPADSLRAANPSHSAQGSVFAYSSRL